MHSLDFDRKQILISATRIFEFRIDGDFVY